MKSFFKKTNIHNFFKKSNKAGVGSGKKPNRIFLDYASSTPILPEVIDKMLPYFNQDFYNANAIYKEGVNLKKLVNSKREEIAKVLHVRDSDIYFTGSGTESDNLALLGVFEYFREEFEKEGSKVPHIIVSKIEHPAIYEVAKEIEKRGGEVTYLDVDEDGLVNLNQLEKSIKENTVLISVIYASNEIGVIEPIHKISRLINLYKERSGRDKHSYPYFHTDASQAPNYLDCNCEKLGVDLMTLDGSKIYGPKGIGCLYKKHNVKIKPIMFGGGQESGLRSGTLNIPAIVGFTEAFLIAQRDFENESERISKLRDLLWKGISEIDSRISLNGSSRYRIANNLNVCVPGINSEFEVIKLDEKGILCAYTTACKTSGDLSESYVIKNLGKKTGGKDEEVTSKESCATSSIRFTLGRNTTKKEIEKTLVILKDVWSK